MVVLALFLGLVLGAFAAWLLASRQRAAAGRELADTRSELAATRAELLKLGLQSAERDLAELDAAERQRRTRVA